MIKGDIAGNSTSDPAAEKFVQHVTFDGLSFQHSQWLMPPDGFEPAQAAAPIEAAVMVEYARNVSLLNCEIAHVGTYGAWLRRGCSGCRLERCHLFDLGGGGVRIGDMSEPKTPSERTDSNTIDNCIIRSGGRLFPLPSASGLARAQTMPSHTTKSPTSSTPASPSAGDGAMPRAAASETRSPTTMCT